MNAHMQAVGFVEAKRCEASDDFWGGQVACIVLSGQRRPNRIGSTVCRIVAVEGTRLRVAELDAIAGTPVLDLKPVMAEFLPREPVRQPAWTRELMRDYWRPAAESA